MPIHFQLNLNTNTERVKSLLKCECGWENRKYVKMGLWVGMKSERSSGWGKNKGGGE